MRVCILRRGHGAHATALLAIVLAGATAFGAAVAAEEFVLIRNAKNPVTNLTRAEVKDMAVGKKKVWPQGQSIVVQMVWGPAGSPELGWFATAVVGAPEATLMAKVRQEVFKGEMRRPIVAPAEKDCLEAVAADPGALGVVRASTAKHLPPDLAVVSVR
jgi:ABC-type phosphate transport system substrate-binding protein